MKKVIAIIRTSTEQQEIDSQRQEVLSLATAAGYTLDEIEVVGKKGSSAIKLDEAYLENLNRVYELIEQEPIEAVFAWAIDRIGRQEEILMQFKNRLINKKIQLVIKNPSLTLLNADGTVNAGVELAFSLFATMAKQEMEQKLARFARAKKRNAAIGKATSGNNTPFGYYKDADKFYKIDEYESSIVRLMYELIITKRYSIRLLCKELNDRGYTHRGKKFGAYFVKRYLSSTIPVGYSIGKKGVQYNYPPIISKEQWEAARKIINTNQYDSYKGKRYYFGAKIMVCYECGRHYSTNGNEYRCKLNQHKIELAEQGLPTCENNISLQVSVVDGILWSLTREKRLNYLLKEKGTTVERNTKQIEVNLQKIAAQQAALEKLEQKRAKVTDDYYSDNITEKERDRYLARFTKAKAEALNIIAKLESENQSLQNQIDNLSELSYNAILKLSAEVLTMSDAKAMYELVHQYIKEVTLERFDALGKKGYLFGVTYTDGTTDKVVYLSRLYKTPVFRAGKPTKRADKVYFVADGSYFKPFDADRLKRDKEGNIEPTKVSGVQITDTDAGNTFRQELLKQRELRRKENRKED